VLTEPATFLYDDLTNLREDCEASAKSRQTEFQEGKKKSAKCGRARDPFQSSLFVTSAGADFADALMAVSALNNGRLCHCVRECST